MTSRRLRLLNFLSAGLREMEESIPAAVPLQTVVNVVPPIRNAPYVANATENVASLQPPLPQSTSWTQALNPLKTSIRDWSQKKGVVSAVNITAENQDNVKAGGLMRRFHSLHTAGIQEEKQLKSSSTEVVIDVSSPPSLPIDLKKSVVKRKSKPAPVPPIRERVANVRSNFSYDTLKERADVWKRERTKKTATSIIPEKDDSAFTDGNSAPNQSDTSPNQASPSEENHRPKICFTKEESDKVDKDILRLMDALEHNHYPFNRDKQHLFAKLRSTRRKQMGLLFAHHELDNTNYFNTDQTDFGCDIISDKLSTMYNVVSLLIRVQ